MSKQIPKEIYAVFKNEFWNVDNPPMAFLNSHRRDTEAFAKKKISQFDWAAPSRGHKNSSVKIENDRVFTRTVAYNMETSQYDVGDWVETRAAFQPRWIDNEPKSGFKIISSVSRTSSANKLWRILHPLGFQFEIYSGCMEDIIMSGDVIKGELIGEFVWCGRSLVRAAK